MASTISFKKKPAAAPAPTSAEVPAPTPVTLDVKTVPVPAPTPAPAPAAVAPTAQTVVAAALNPQTAALAAPTPAGQLSTENYGGIGGFEGEFSSKDMATPYLSILMKTSKNFDDHPDWLGQFVYDKETCLGEEIKVVFLRAAKFYKEKTEWGAGGSAGDFPQRFTKLADARAAGFNESQLEECADLDLLIEVDADAEGVADLAHITDGDKSYILARFGVRSTAYRRTVGILAKDSSGFLKGNLINGFYTLTTEKRQNDKGSWYVPTLKVAGATSQSLRTQIVERMGS